MSEIIVKNLSKKYLLCPEKNMTSSFRESFSSFFRSSNKSKSCSTLWALNDISFEIQKGDVVGIIGRNGSGKSTLLKILSRITAPTSGFVAVKGRVASLLEVGTGFHAELTGRENILFNGIVLGMKYLEIKNKFDEIVAFSGVENFLDIPVKRYSSGMLLRLAFSVAAHLEPDILIIDEVLAVGDFSFQKKCLNIINNLQKKGTTTLLVSHNIGAVKRFCNKALFLQGGVIKRYGRVEEVVQAYLSEGNIQRASFETSKGKSIGVFSLIDIISVKLCNKDYKIADFFTVHEEINVIVKYALQSDKFLSLGIKVYNEEGELLFFSIEEVSSSDDKFYEGVYQACCIIPSNFLNQGTLFFSLVIIQSGMHEVMAEDNIVSCTIVDDMKSEGARGSFTGIWPATRVRPTFLWTIQKENNAYPHYSNF